MISELELGGGSVSEFNGDDLPGELELGVGGTSEFDVDDLPDELELGGETLDVGLQQVHLINTQYHN